MEALHDSRMGEYRSPFGALPTGREVTLAIDVWNAPNAQVSLRTWVEGEGERVLAMADASPQGDAIRHRIKISPDKAGILWYHFIIVDEAEGERRYGAQPGKTGGAGRLGYGEPPSFQLTIYDADKTRTHDLGKFNHVNGLGPDEAIAHFLRDELTAPELVDTFDTLRECCPAPSRDRKAGVLDREDKTPLLMWLSGHTRVGDDPAEETAFADLDDGQRGLAKGRFWCASLIQALLPHDLNSEWDRLATAWGHEDRDCETIVRNASDLSMALPLFGGDGFSWFAANDDVFGFWRWTDGERGCVLLNRSLSRTHDIAIEMTGESASEVIAGYHVELDEHPTCETVGIPEALESPRDTKQTRYAHVHLSQLGSAVLLFHPERRLARPLDAGFGVLAHITSLPAGDASRGAETCGTLGEPTRAFIDLLAQANVRYWQVLPVNPTDEFGSPYAGISAFAGNTRLVEGGVRSAAEDLVERHPDEYRAFCEREADWLDPYACFMALRAEAGAGVAWQAWPKSRRAYDPKLVEKNEKLALHAESCRQEQFAFERQWRDLRDYAHERGILVIGDMPIYVSADSADVWAHPELFQLDAAGHPAECAGCPPDSFAEEGQIWGNPLYDWNALRESGYSWWLRRLERAFDLYDVVRLDHFIGFARYFAIPAGSKATAGNYQPGPGLDFFREAHEKFGPLPVIAEDLGLITPAVRALGAACGFPGMDVIQFADGNDPLSGYRPRPGKIAYSGTHDNHTLRGYVKTRYPHEDELASAERLLEYVASCDAPVRIAPLQDIALLDDEARMNIPGTVEGNWKWQATLADLESAADRLPHLVNLGKR